VSVRSQSEFVEYQQELCVYLSVMLLMLQDVKTAGCNKRSLCKPRFLQSMLKEIVLAGKSMELLVSLGQRVDILRGTCLLAALLWRSIFTRLV